MTEERKAQLRAQLNDNSYLDKAIETIGIDISSGRKALIPVSEKIQGNNIVLRDRHIIALKSSGMAPRHIAENMNLTIGQVRASISRSNLRKVGRKKQGSKRRKNDGI